MRWNTLLTFCACLMSLRPVVAEDFAAVQYVSATFQPEGLEPTLPEIEVRPPSSLDESPLSPEPIPDPSA